MLKAIDWNENMPSSLRLAGSSAMPSSLRVLRADAERSACR